MKALLVALIALVPAHDRGRTGVIHDSVDVIEINECLHRPGGQGVEKLLTDGEAEMISMSRPFIREPDLANRWKKGSRRKADCISCNGCLKYRDEPVRCIMLDKVRK